jgi:hypothetical protein
MAGLQSGMANKKPIYKVRGKSEGRSLDFVAKIDGLTFGSIVVEGSKYRRDILIFADGTVKKRKGGFLMFGSHNIKKQELEELSQGQPEILIVGTGTNGAAHIAPEAESWARGKNLNLLVQPSYDAVAKLNELAEQKKKVAALIHITC